MSVDIPVSITMDTPVTIGMLIFLIGLWICIRMLFSFRKKP